MTSSACEGRAELHFIRRGARTILHRSYATFPAQVIRPFYGEESSRAYLHLLTPTGGMLGGDRLEIHVVLGAGAQVCLTTASATKVHPATAVPAEQSLLIELAPGSCLEYLPEPTILFRQARWRQHTLIRRAAESRLLWVERWSAGRVARSEVFAFSALDTAFEVYTEGHLSVFDRMRIHPATYPARRLGLWAGQPHLLTLYMLQETPPPSAWCQAMQAQLAAQPVRAGLSQLAAPGVVARALADEAEPLAAVMHTIWRRIREDLWGEPGNFRRWW